MSTGALLLVLALGCRVDGTGPETEATTLEVTPDSVTLAPGNTADLEATPRDSDGNAVTGYTISWSSEDPTVATVDTDGTATGQSAGTTRVTATAERDGRSLSERSEVAVEAAGDGSTSGSLITGLEPAAYETDTLESGIEVYVDRDFTVDAVPAGYDGWLYVRTANDDKNSDGDSAVVFTLEDTATVAVAYDERATQLPDWLADWTATGDTLGTTDVDHPVFARDFGPGEVALGGNMSGGAEGASSMYMVLAARSGSASDGGSDSTATGSGSLQVATSTTGDSLDDNGYSVSVDGGSTQSVGINDTTILADLTAEDHSVELTDVASNCSVSGYNPRTVTISDKDTVTTTFTVSCDTTSSPDGIPGPDSNDYVHLDTRAGGAQSLQKSGLTTIQDVDDEYPSWSHADGVEFTANYDGNGTSAFIFPILHNAGTQTCEGAPDSQQNLWVTPDIPNDNSKDAGDGFIGGPGREVFLQFKRRFGRHPNDGSPHPLGPVDDFEVHHKDDGEGPGGRKWIVWKREDGSERFDILKQNTNSGIKHADGLVGLGFRREMSGHGPQVILARGDIDNEIEPWWPDAHFPQYTGGVGEYTFTVHIKFESSEGAGDGELTYWVDDTKYKEATGLYPGSPGIGNPKIGIPTWICPPQDQTEYFWDIVIWEKQ